MMRHVMALAAALALASCAASTPPPAAPASVEADHPEATPYDPSIDAGAAVDAALVRAAERDTRVLLVLGGNWCHDSRALAGWLETPRFAALVADRYELVYVNVGLPQTGDGFNLDIARRFGIDALPGTPNLFVIDSDGTLLNPDSVTTWRNAASRSGEAIYAELEALAPQK